MSNLDRSNLPSLEQLKSELLQVTRDRVDLENAVLSKGTKWPLPNCLTPYQIAMVIQAVEHVRCIQCGGKRSMDLLGVYQATGPDAGLYVTDGDTISRMIRKYNRDLTERQIANIEAILRENIPHVPRCQDRDLIAVNNGLFDYRTKTLHGFSPDKVYLAKCRVDYRPAPMLPTIRNDADGSDWDVETWVSELSDDPEIVQLIWEILGAIVRPYVSWDKAAWFYSKTGSNGKGSLCALMRNLCGKESCASIALANFGEKFMLEPLIRSTAIVVDENDVGIFIDRVANLKGHDERYSSANEKGCHYTGQKSGAGYPSQQIFYHSAAGGPAPAVTGGLRMAR